MCFPDWVASRFAAHGQEVERAQQVFDSFKQINYRPCNRFEWFLVDSTGPVKDQVFCKIWTVAVWTRVRRQTTRRLVAWDFVIAKQPRHDESMFLSAEMNDDGLLHSCWR